MNQAHAKGWDELHSRMLRSEVFGGAIMLAFQAFIVAGLVFS